MGLIVSRTSFDFLLIEIAFSYFFGICLFCTVLPDTIRITGHIHNDHSEATLA